MSCRVLSYCMGMVSPICIFSTGMVFNVNIGLSKLINSEAASDDQKMYSLFIGDTVIVNDGEPATVLTKDKKRAKNISIFLKVLPKVMEACVKFFRNHPWYFLLGRERWRKRRREPTCRRIVRARSKKRRVEGKNQSNVTVPVISMALCSLCGIRT